MKKIFLLFSISFLFFSSCSGDSESVSDSEIPLTTDGFVIRKVDRLLPTEIIYPGLFYYNGNKLDKIGTATTYQKYTYSGNLITQTAYYEDNVLKLTEYFTYDSNERLIERKGLTYQDSTGFKTIYTYNSDGTCSTQLFRGNLTTQNTIDDLYNKKIFFTNGQVQKIETYRIVAGNPVTLTVTYGYDDKLDPYNVILGYKKLTFYEVGNHGNTNNIVSYTYSDNTTSDVDVDLVEYTYNSYGFPATMKTIDHPDSGTTDYDIKVRYMYDQP